MLVLSSYCQVPSAALLQRPRVVVIGNFDGVHHGHKALLGRARAIAKTLGATLGQTGTGAGSVVVLTFSPHPARVLAPHLAPPLLSSEQRKRELLAQEGVDALVEQPFDRAFSQLSPEDFVEKVLLGTDLSGLGASAVVVGYDFSFGKARAGNTQVLTELLGRHGATVTVVPPVSVVAPPGGTPLVCSSTLVRKAIQAGRPEEATLLLGRYPELEGEVVHGAGRGRSIGVPTANVLPSTEVLPAVGVYAAWAELLALDSVPGEPPRTASAGADAGFASAQPRLVVLRRPAAVNVGYNPTFTSPRGDSPVSQQVASNSALSPISVEAHLLTEPGEAPLPSLYGRTLRLQFVSRVRAEQKFPSVAALVEQIQSDIATVRERLGVSK